MDPQRQPLRVALALGPASVHEKTLMRLSRKHASDFALDPISNLDPLLEKDARGIYDLLLASLDIPDLQKDLHSRSLQVPVVLLTESSCEPDALALLEQGLILDYLLSTPSQPQRL